MKKNINIGDYVTVKSAEECASAVQDVIHFVPYMKPFCGKKLQVTDFDFKRGWLELEGCEWLWSEDMVITKEDLRGDICEYCPCVRGGNGYPISPSCEGDHCDEAYDNYLNEHKDGTKD